MALSRRGFLKEAGLFTAGTVLTSLCANSACQESTSSTEAPVSNTGPGYIPPADMPPLLSVPGREFRVAADRRYSMEHVWVLPASPDSVVIGITEKLVKFLEGPYGLDLTAPGRVFDRGDTFGYIEGFKAFVDLICPVSGRVASINQELIEQQVPFNDQNGEGEGIPALNTDAYRSGWLLVIELSDPQELDDLLSPEEYIALNAKSA